MFSLSVQDTVRGATDGLVVKNPPANAGDLGSEDPLEKEWQPTPAFLPGESHGQRSLVGYSPWGCKASDTTELVMIIYDIVHRKMWNSVNPVVEYS